MSEVQNKQLEEVQTGVDGSNVLKIVIDDGSKAAKVVFLDERGELKTHLSANSFVPNFRVAHTGTNPYNYFVDEYERYSHHKEATEALETTDVAHQYDEISRLNVHHALHSSGIEPQAVHLHVTLPLSQFYNSMGELNTENIQRKKDNLLKPVGRHVNGQTVSFNVAGISVFPESLPAVSQASELSTIESYEVSLVLDLGGTTLDAASISGQLEQISKVKGFDRIGCSVVYDEIRRYLQSVNVNDSDAYIDHLIGNRSDANALKITDSLRTETFEAVNAAVKKLQDMVVKAVKQIEERPHYIFIVGGGSFLIADAIEENYPNAKVVVVNNPQLALATSIAESVLFN
ncbi:MULTISPECIES: plasmid segregation protein ParM domain-containing protein [Buttiauxella]|uniref:PRTRC system protein D n=1 Tax=Buttiauxella agrestis TaxID=82977 RepID=A0A381KND3_9ENTR|nr:MULTISPECIES: plasmid segregation protein ParM domain-containing protein [Buttiauxella]TDX12073.1 plasmid segregation actin-type ATPase ParM [Buttiauxella sp. BIGb0552]SUY92798.1 PRTRC system protein D [Buttiauxella agrestis]